GGQRGLGQGLAHEGDVLWLWLWLWLTHRRGHARTSGTSALREAAPVSRARLREPIEGSTPRRSGSRRRPGTFTGFPRLHRDAAPTPSPPSPSLPSPPG